MYKFLVCFLVSICFNISAQDELKYVSSNYQVASSLPEWVQLMYAEKPDLGQITNAYEAYYKTNDFIKTNHTQFYKRMMRAITRNVESSPRNNRTSSSSNRMPDWSCVGPWDWDHDAAGRSYAPGSAHVYAVEQSISNPDVLYAGTATAGVWKTIDRGLNWTPLTYDLDINGVYAIEIDHGNPDIAYASLFNSIYKTIDGGSTWVATGSSAFQNIGLGTRDIMMHPTNNQILLVAADAGLYRTTNGGTDWTEIDANSHRDIEFHPTNANITYAVKILTDSTAFVKSTNAGASFSEVGEMSWPTVDSVDYHQRRVEIGVSLDEPDHVYAQATGSAYGGSGLYGIYKSTDQGANWTFQCCGPQPAGPPNLATGNINIMGWQQNGSDNGGQYYYNVGFDVSPTNADSLWAAGTNLWVSGDGGVSMSCPAKWSQPGESEYVHADIHDIHYYAHTGEIWIACDGGIFLSTDNGANFERRNFGIEGSDFWGYGQGWWEGDIMLGGTYHNGTLLKEDNVYLNDWICTDGGDGNYGLVNPGRPKNVHSWFNIKDLQSDRTIAPITRGNPQEANASYITGQDSDILFHPNYYDTWWVGSDSLVMYTEDNGFSFTEKSFFLENLAAMDISMSNPDVLYATTWPGWWNTKKIYKSTDGGSTWTDVTIPSAQLNGNEWVPYDIVIDPIDPNRVFVARTSMYSGTNLDNERLFETTDGGLTWTEIGSPALNGQPISNIGGHYGISGGLFVGTRKGMWYYDDNIATFENITSDMPVSTFSEKLMPYYREQKVRNATNRSVWERPMPYTSTRVIARAATAKKEYYCTSDTVEFTDLSIVSENAISYLWEFPHGTPSTSTERLPKVVFDCPGEFDITLTVTDDNGTDTKTFEKLVKIIKDCDDIVDPSLALNTTNQNDHVVISDFNMINVTNFTMTAWIKPNGFQDNYTGIFMNDGSAAGLNFKNGTNELGYHWPGGQWQWNSGLEVAPDVWSHVALVVTPTSVTAYLNGESSIHSISVNPVDMNNVRIGSYLDWNDRNYRGDIDEVVIYNRALTIDEIRLGKHIVKDPTLDPTIHAYYKFNAANTSTVYDAANGHDGTARNSSIKENSNGPYGQGVSDLLTIAASGAGVITAPNSGVMLDWGSGSSANGDIVISHIVTNPVVQPSGDHVLSRGYYIINNYGNNTQFNGLDNIAFTNAGMISTHMASNVLPTYFKRAENEGAAAWFIPYSGTIPFILDPGIYGGIEIPNSNFIRRFDDQFIFTRDAFAPDTANVTMAAIGSNPEIEGGSSAELALISDHKGLIFPYHNAVSIQGLNSPLDGSIVYDTTENVLRCLSAGAWVTLVSKTEFIETSNLIATSDFGLDLNGSIRDDVGLLNLANAGGVVVLPSYTKPQMSLIEKPSPGMMIYNTDDHVVLGFTGSAWMKIANSPTSLTNMSSTGSVEGLTIGDDTKSPSAAVEISNKNNRTLMLTSVNITQVSNPIKGLMVFDPALKSFMIFNGDNWQQFKTSFIEE